MKKTIPPKLKKGDEIRVVAPARSLGTISDENVKYAEERLREMGFTVTYGAHVRERDAFGSSSIAARVSDLHDAFSDSSVAGILTVIGGFNSNQLLRYLDYDLIRANPKVLCGYSDITALTNAITAKTGLVTYSGPQFSTFAMQKGFEYIAEYFEKCLMNDAPFDLIPSPTWSNDSWYEDQENRTFIDNEGFWVMNEGEVTGTIVGGNQCTLNLLQGTEFMPSLDGTVLFLEEDDEEHVVAIDRDLQSLIHLPDFKGVRGIVIGRFQPGTGMTRELLTKIIATKKELANIPVIANVDFGHTTPMITFPIGGEVSLKVAEGDSRIAITEH